MSWTRFKPTDKGMLLPGNRMKFGIIITAALLMLLLTAIQYLYMRNNMVEQLEENAESATDESMSPTTANSTTMTMAVA